MSFKKSYLTSHVSIHSFCLSLLALFISLSLIKIYFIILASLNHSYTPSSNQNPYQGFAAELISSVFVTPLLETLVFQLSLFLILRMLLHKQWIIFSVITFLFALSHFRKGIIIVFTALFFGAIFTYAFFYWHDKEKSLKKGFQAAFETHAFYNFWWLLLNFVPASLIF